MGGRGEDSRKVREIGNKKEKDIGIKTKKYRRERKGGSTGGIYGMEEVNKEGRKVKNIKAWSKERKEIIEWEERRKGRM